MSEVEFWRMTPREFTDLMEMHAERQRREDYRAGVVAAVVANCHRGKDADVFQPKDFFGSLAEEDEPAVSLEERELEARALKGLREMRKET